MCIYTPQVLDLDSIKIPTAKAVSSIQVLLTLSEIDRLLVIAMTQQENSANMKVFEIMKSQRERSQVL